MVSLLSIFVCLNTNGFIGVNFFSSSKEKIQRLLNVVLLTSLLVYIVMLTMMCCFTSTFEQMSRFNTSLSVLCHIFLLVECCEYVAA